MVFIYMLSNTVDGIVVDGTEDEIMMRMIMISNCFKALVHCLCARSSAWQITEMYDHVRTSRWI